MINKFLKLLTARFVVRNPNIPITAGYMKAFLRDERGFTKADRIPDSVVAIIVRDVYRRTKEERAGGHVRWGEFYAQIELAADHVIAIYNGETAVDNRIKEILVFHGLI